MTISTIFRSEEPEQGSIFDDEPKPNSREDIGYKTQPTKPTEPPIPVNLAPGTIQEADVRKFIDWLFGTKLPMLGEVTVREVSMQLSGFIPSDLRWLCLGIKQAGNIPAPADMRQALLNRDVARLRLKR